MMLLINRGLINKYENANALLILLTNSIHGRAQFPHKISEYLASDNLTIITNYGIIRYYF